MSAWEECCVIEDSAFAKLRPYIRMTSDGRYVTTNKGPLAKFMQETVGDVLINKRGELFALELKSEQNRADKTGNLFLEQWSNRNTTNKENFAQRGANPGWMYKSRADYLWYYFIGSDELYIIKWWALRRWAFGYEGSAPRLYTYPVRVQTTHIQSNETVGYIVPIKDLQKDLGDENMQYVWVEEALRG